MYLGACFIFAFLSLAKLAIVKFMRKRLGKREQRKAGSVGEEMEHLNGLDASNSVENTPERKLTLTRRLIRKANIKVHDKYWQRLLIQNFLVKFTKTFIFNNYFAFHLE